MDSEAAQIDGGRLGEQVLVTAAAADHAEQLYRPTSGEQQVVLSTRKIRYRGSQQPTCRITVARFEFIKCRLQAREVRSIARLANTSRASLNRGGLLTTQLAEAVDESLQHPQPLGGAETQHPANERVVLVWFVEVDSGIGLFHWQSISRPPRRESGAGTIRQKAKPGTLGPYFKRCAQFMARCRSAELRSGVPVVFPRPAGVTAARSALCGAKTP